MDPLTITLHHCIVSPGNHGRGVQNYQHNGLTIFILSEDIELFLKYQKWQCLSEMIIARLVLCTTNKEADLDALLGLQALINLKNKTIYRYTRPVMNKCTVPAPIFSIFVETTEQGQTQNHVCNRHKTVLHAYPDSIRQ